MVAEGIGSRIELPNVTAITGGTHYDSELLIRALHGGTINLSGVQQIIDPDSGDNRNRKITVEATGLMSSVNLASLGSFIDVYGNTTSAADGEYSGLFATWGGRINVPALHTLDGVWVYAGCAMDLSTLSRLERGRLEVAGYTLPLPSLTSLYDSDVVATGGEISAPLVTSLNKANLYASSGGMIVLPGVVEFDSVDTTFMWQATGPGSVIDLSGLEYLEGTTAGILLLLRLLHFQRYGQFGRGDSSSTACSRSSIRTQGIRGAGRLTSWRTVRTAASGWISAAVHGRERECDQWRRPLLATEGHQWRNHRPGKR